MKTLIQRKTFDDRPTQRIDSNMNVYVYVDKKVILHVLLNDTCTRIISTSTVDYRTTSRSMSYCSNHAVGLPFYS